MLRNVYNETPVCYTNSHFLENDVTTKKKYRRKRFFCLYCKRLYVNLQRHLLQKHACVDIIEKASKLPSEYILVFHF